MKSFFFALSYHLSSLSHCISAHFLSLSLFLITQNDPFSQQQASCNHFLTQNLSLFHWTLSFSLEINSLSLCPWFLWYTSHNTFLTPSRYNILFLSMSLSLTHTSHNTFLIHTHPSHTHYKLFLSLSLSMIHNTHFLPFNLFPASN